MKGYTVLFMFVLTFAVSNNNFLMAQVQRNQYDKPLSELTTLQTKCLADGFGLDVFGNCQLERQYSWVAFGGGWKSVFRWTNTKLDSTTQGPVTVQITLMSKDGSPSSGYVKDNRSTNEAPAGVIAWPLLPGESVEAEILYPRSYDEATKTSSPDPSTLSTGSVWVKYKANDSEFLKGLVPSSLNFLSADSNGVYQWNAVEDETPASEYWVSQISETFDREANWQAAKTNSAAISNPTDAPVFVDIQLNNQYGAFVAKTSIYLKVRETNAFLFRDIFGDQMFPGAKDFTGTVNLSRRDASPLNPGKFQGVSVVFFRVEGNCMGGVKASAVKK